nr:alpha 16 mannosyltransferase [Hymenolepis microstoma]
MTFTQFHLPFYSTRTLPNTFALITVIYALAFLLKGSDHHFIILSGLGILVFRSELVLFYGPLLLFGLYFNLVKIRPTLIVTGIITTLASLCFTVAIDSFFWRRWIWPEGEVFYFNAIENKSHLWGTMPFYWYFLIALPKALMATFGLILCANFIIPLCSTSFDPISREWQTFFGLELVSLIFISIYSFLPHKELRFIFYALPIFNLLASYFWIFVERHWHMCLDARTARELASKQKLRGKSPTTKYSRFISPAVRRIYRFSVILCYASLVFNICISLGLVYVSYYNYPGGQAISRLNNWPGLSSRNDIHVYISNLAAQTGVNRFQEVHSNWIYNKTEGIDNSARGLLNGPFTHFILEASKDHLGGYSAQFRRLFTVKSFSGFKFNLKEVLWNKRGIPMSPALVVYERINGA